MSPKTDGYKDTPGACSDEMGIGPVDTRNRQEGPAVEGHAAIKKGPLTTPVARTYVG